MPRPPAVPPESEGLSDEEIAAILEAEGAMPPEAGHAPPRHSLSQREPAEGPFGKWLVWLLLAFIIAGAVKAYF